MHVEKTPGIWHSPTDRKRHRLSVLTATCRIGKPAHPSVLAKLLWQDWAGVVGSSSAGTAGILPLGLGRQTVGLAFLFREPFAELDRLVPAHKNYCLVVLFGKTEFAAKLAVFGIELLVLGISDLSRGDAERLCYAHNVGGSLVPIAPLYPVPSGMIQAGCE